ncbi:MAG TPA: cbb3-type cytochrome oxidase assembly protein CcoS [Candidatus Angelobacter sp.]|jgi:cbb3-type cytochrome oxidase maturation protein|nr:cbb3-type cytochrome oxidase assembly protein CcoS [Candidatus Angelobacter sp.]
MESLYFLVPCALIFIGLAIKVLFWALNNGQYDNLDTEAHRILFDTEQSKQDKSSQDKPSQEKSTPAPEAPDDKTPSV